MLPQTAVLLRKTGMSIGEIADQLSTSPGQVSCWFRLMDFDPVEYHLDQIADLVTSGIGFYTALEQCGFAVGGVARHRIHGRLLERGISCHGSKRYEHTPKHRKDTRRRCQSCTILLEPHEHELCDVCRDIQNGGSWLGHLPLTNLGLIADLNLGEVAGYGC